MCVPSSFPITLLLLLLNPINKANASGSETWDYQNIFQKNVIDGRKAPINRYPYHATVNVKSSDDDDLYNICGGTLIHPNWIVTAAHCTNSKNMDIVVEIGRDSYRNSDAVEDNYELRDIKFKCQHPFFNPANFQYDIALLYFENGVEDIDPVKIDYDAVDLTAYSQKFNDDDYYNADDGNNMSTTSSSPLRVIGYGSTSIFGDGPYPSRLQEADVFYINDRQCETAVRNTGADMFTNWTMCASGFGIQDTCIGDSGGPLLIPGVGEDNDAYKSDTLIGVVSIGPVPCMEDDTPVLYTRISKAYNWIMSVMDGDMDLCK